MPPSTNPRKAMIDRGFGVLRLRRGVGSLRNMALSGLSGHMS